MPNADLPIMVVDDARFSGAVIGRTLKAAGFKDIRTASSAQQALTMLDSRPVSVLIADWLMPEMDGLELASKVRQMDEASNHFTYIMLLTAKEGDKALEQAFDQGVDDFINKSAMNQQLLPRIYAADRLSALQNRLLKENQLLVESNQRFKKHSLVDPLTGLGNAQFAIERLKDTILHARSRNGAACLMIINIDNYKPLMQEHGKQILREIIVGASRRLRQLVRPLDAVARLSNEQFAIVTYQADIMQANAVTYRRIYDALNIKALKSSKGFISLKAAMCMSAADEETGFPAADKMLAITQRQIPSARETGRLMVVRWRHAKSN
ncbi:response regulator [Ketobacter sp. MCCC 1A13808]|uniref:GGDEF domain-containing response regulator n=1 Tax=Ketobacter sp. MCCC 1A13808 TaxID=2602738 RepID=UPI0012EB3CD3|nr:response regulator [Ketobacter sp. MCCC 1A13808]MVF11159.1 response regulator [Ketobacter sp. MCCC 1A13808]